MNLLVNYVGSVVVILFIARTGWRMWCNFVDDSVNGRN
jgi:hypothetical protein